uniref:Mitochondrial genome maintenance exonuclease 1 n=1 Tax=Salvator merianae TaxID=96440 RepID=A0A8D0EG30_SALMN
MGSFFKLNRKCRCLILLKGLLMKKKPLCKSLATSSSHYWKKKSTVRYDEPGQEKYRRSIHCLSSCKGGSESLQSLQEEDNVLYGPESKPSAEIKSKLNGMCFPLINPIKSSLTEKTVQGKPLKISLKRNNLASISAVLQQTVPLKQAFYLERWKQRMILELGNDGFAEYTKKLFEQGKLFHSALENLLLNEETSLKGQEEDSSVSGALASVQHVLQDVTGVRVLESAVQHENLHYRGIVDCVAKYRGTLCVIEWKTSEKSKPFLQNTFDSPLQLAAYVGAINHDENYNFQVGCGLLVVAYKDGSPAHPHYIDTELCSQYWNKWLIRLEEYKEKKKHNATE